ncbi:MAG TPA: dihydrofolate reductase family protein [Puia sp.]|nr:dihydrofolate reductase family protein [Puia sp.]
MRNLVYAINLTADGCCDHTKIGGSDEILDYFTELMLDFDLFVYGRITFDLMVPFWPDLAKNHSGPTNPANEFAKKFDSIRKLVFSHSLDNLADERSRIAHGNLEDEILAVKKEQGKKIMVGGVDLPGQLIGLGLVDEFYFVLHPIIAGDGRRLFTGVNLAERLNLKLADTKVLPSGCIALHYLKP